VNAEAAWRRVETGLAAAAADGHVSPGRRHLAVPLARIALAAAAAGCLFFFLGWHFGGSETDAKTGTVRITPAIWRAEVIAADPLDGATDALINAVQDATP